MEKMNEIRAYLKIAFCALSAAMLEAEKDERWDVYDRIDDIAGRFLWSDTSFKGDAEADFINDKICDLAEDIK